MSTMNRPLQLKLRPVWIALASAALILAGFGLWRLDRATTEEARKRFSLVGDGPARSTIADLLEKNPGSLLSTDSFTVVTRDGVATLDSIVVVGDSTVFEGLRRSGLLDREVQHVNRQRRALAVRAGTMRRRTLDSLAGLTVGWLAINRNADGARIRVLPEPPDGSGVSRTKAPVLAAESRLEHVLLAPDGARLFPFDNEGGGRFRALTDGCHLAADTTEGLRKLLCVRDPKRSSADDAVLRMRRAKTGVALQGLVLELESGTASLNGVRLRRDSAVQLRRGDLLLAGRRALVYDLAHTQALVPAQLVSGRHRVSVPSDSSHIWLVPLTMAGGADGRAVRLTLDLDLQLAVTRSLANTARGRGVRWATVVIADLATGAIITAAQYGDLTTPAGRYRLLEPSNFGSAVKPVHTAAVLVIRPQLLAFRARADGRDVARWVPGIRTFSSGASRCTEPLLSIAAAIVCSNNAVMVSLIGAAGRDVLARGLDSLFGEHVTEASAEAPQPSVQLWPTELARSFELPAILTPAYSQLRLAADRVRPDRLDADDVRTFALGGDAARWTPLALTQAFARIATGRSVSLHFLPTRDGQSQILSGMHGTVWHDTLLTALGGVLTAGTGRGYLTAAQRRPGRLYYAKTGTLDQDGANTRTLLFATGTPDAGSRRVGCGTVVLIHAQYESTIDDIVKPMLERLANLDAFDDGPLVRACRGGA